MAWGANGWGRYSKLIRWVDMNKVSKSKVCWGVRGRGR